MPKNTPPSYESLVTEILSKRQEPILLDELIDQVLERHPSTAKNPHTAVRSTLKYQEGMLYASPDRKLIYPMPLVMNGAQYRIRLDRELVSSSALPLNAFIWGFQSRKDVHFVDSQNLAIPHIITITRPEPKDMFSVIFGGTEVFTFKKWFRSQDIHYKDHIIVTVLDWENLLFRLEKEGEQAFKQKDIDLINRQFADLFYEYLEKSQDERIYASIVVANAYVRLKGQMSCIPDHWTYIIKNDDRMRSSNGDITYSDGNLSMWESMIEENLGIESKTPRIKKPGSDKNDERVYCFRVAFAFRPSIWRDIEIQGKQTLVDLDRILRNVFNHDTYDHLSGFWKRVERASGAKRKRYREVEIGKIVPMAGEGEGDDTTLLELDLQPGDELKYVYDFGDWIEHILTLRNVQDTPQEKTKYPREIARNKPHYEYCVFCKESGKESVAKWVCVSCSNDEQRDIWVCEKCSRKHDDHYLEEITY